MATAVMAARGGVGATSLAVAMAVAADAVLVDLDDLAGGVDVWLGAEDLPGVRWSGLTLAGGALAASELVRALPVADGCRFLAADRPRVPDAAAIARLLAVLAADAVVIDLPRQIDERSSATLERCDSLMVVTPATIAGSVAAHAIASQLADVVPIGLVVVGTAEPASTVGEVTGLPVLAAVRDVSHLPRAALALADGMAVSSGAYG